MHTYKRGDEHYKLIANYINGRKTYTTYRNHMSRQCQCKTGVPQGGVLSPTLFNIYTSYLPPSSAPVQVMHDLRRCHHHHIHTHSTSAVMKYIQPYLHTAFTWTKQNNIILNPDKTTCTLFTPDPAEYRRNLDLKIHSTALPMATHPKVMGLTFHPKLTHSTHIHDFSISVHAHSHFPYTSTYSSTPHNTNRKHNIHRIPYTNTQHTSTLQCLKHYFQQRPLHNNDSHTPPLQHT